MTINTMEKDQISAASVPIHDDIPKVDHSNIAQAQANLSLKDAVRYYWKAAAWSVLLSNATIMESYGMLLINSFFAMPQFVEGFGEQLPDGSYSLSARWQIGLSMSSLVGLIFGVFANGYCADRWGLRAVMMVSHVALIAFIFITFFAPNVGVLLVGILLISIPNGFFAAATPSYAAEISPAKLTGYLTTYVNLCWVMGKMISFGVVAGTLSVPGEWAYRIPFAVQWAWPPFLVVAVYYAPESPWWLVRKGRMAEAEASLRRVITAPEDVIDPKQLLEWMYNTVEAEKEKQVEGTYMDCFRGVNLRRTEIAMISWGCQILPGFAIQNYITYFFTLAGLPTTASFNMSVGNAGIAFVGTVSSWFVMSRVGWRTIYLTGLCAMFPVMALVGFLDLASGKVNDSTLRWVQSGLLLLWFFLYGISIGPIPYGIAANVGSPTLRIKTVALGRNTYYFFNVVNTVASPYMLNAAEANLKGKAAFPAAIFTLILIVWTFFRLPEIKGMTPQTLNMLFDERVPARKFLQASKKYQ